MQPAAARGEPGDGRVDEGLRKADPRKQRNARPAAAQQRLFDHRAKQTGEADVGPGVQRGDGKRFQQPAIQRAGGPQDLVDFGAARGTTQRQQLQIIRGAWCPARGGFAENTHQGMRPHSGPQRSIAPRSRHRRTGTAVRRGHQGSPVRRFAAGKTTPLRCRTAAGGYRCRCGIPASGRNMTGIVHRRRALIRKASPRGRPRRDPSRPRARPDRRRPRAIASSQTVAQRRSTTCAISAPAPESPDGPSHGAPDATASRHRWRPSTGPAASPGGRTASSRRAASAKWSRASSATRAQTAASPGWSAPRVDPAGRRRLRGFRAADTAAREQRPRATSRRMLVSCSARPRWWATMSASGEASPNARTESRPTAEATRSQ